MADHQDDDGHQRRQTPGLNEALLSVHRIAPAPAATVEPPLELLYQTNECYSCPLLTLAPITSTNTNETTTTADRQFIISTKFDFRLEVRQGAVEPFAEQSSNQTQKTAGWCRLSDLSLNSQGRYRLDVSARGGANVDSPWLCSLTTLDSGECLLCPFALLGCLLLALIGLEQLYTKFWRWPNRRQRKGRCADYGRASAGGVGDRKLSSTASAGGAATESAAAAAAAGDPAPGNDGDSTAGSSTGGSHSPDQGQTLATATTTVSGRRVECLDAFRGLTLAGMIFVNYGGAGYAAWDHTPWDGLTPADLVFPFFVFSMGASVAISVRALVKRQASFASSGSSSGLSLARLAGKILRRSVILALLGLCLNSKAVDYTKADGLARLRLTGVLQRFAVSYLVIAFMYTLELTLQRWLRAQSISQVPYLSRLIGASFELLTAINYLGAYLYMTYFFQYDAHCPPGYVGPGGQTEDGRYANCTGGAAAWLDHLVLGAGHIYNDHEVKQVFMTRVTHDPEGILGYSTSILLTLLGLQCGKILIGAGTHKRKLLALVQWSLLLMAASSTVLFIPVNKRLWSLSFIIVTGLAAFLIITLLYLVIDVYAYKQSLLLRLVSSAGKNSIFLYVGHSLISGLLPWWFPVADEASHLQLLLRLSWATLVWLIIAHYMALKGLFIRI